MNQNFVIKPSKGISVFNKIPCLIQSEVSNTYFTMFPSISYGTCALVVVVLVLGHTSSLIQTWITGARTLLSPANKTIITTLYTDYASSFFLKFLQIKILSWDSRLTLNWSDITNQYLLLKNEPVIQLFLTPSSRQSLNVLTCLEAQFETTNNNITLNLRSGVCSGKSFIRTSLAINLGEVYITVKLIKCRIWRNDYFKDLV